MATAAAVQKHGIIAALSCFLSFTNAQPLVSPSASPGIPTTLTTMNDIAGYGNDVVVIADEADLFLYYENYAMYSSPTTSFSQASTLRVAGCPAPSPTPVPSDCQIYSNAAGQSLQTFDVLLGGLSASNSGAGSVVVWKDTRINWSQQQVLVARDALAGDSFGADVALDMNNPHIALIGAPNSDDKGSSSGSAYIFASSPTGKYWTEGQRLVGSTETTNCLFGSEVQVMGRQAVVLAPGCCKVFLYEQEKPKPVPPPPPKGCGSDDDSTNRTSKSLRQHFHASNIRPFEDIHQTKTLQWSEQQVLDFSSSGWCTRDTDSYSYMTMSYDDGNLVLGFPYYNEGANVDVGLVQSINLETFRGDCDSNIFPTMLSFEELFDMKESTIQAWEQAYSGLEYDSRCTHPPKPTPQCEVSRWSVQQTITSGLYECSYYGSNVAVCEDLLFVQSSNYENVDGDNPSNCNTDVQTGYNPDFMDGAVVIYQRQSDGTWAYLQTLLGNANQNQNYGNPLTCSGAEAYWGQTVVTSYSYSPRPAPFPSPAPSPTVDYKYISTYGATTTIHYDQDSQWDCAIIMLGDHFGDGWNGADLVISGPGADKQRYTDSCDSVTNPYYIRWCPVDNNVCGEVTMEIPGAEGIPFHQEIYWGVYLEDSGRWVYGDYNTKLTFDWDCANHDLSLVEGKSVLTNSSCDCDCLTYRPTPKPTPQKKPIDKYTTASPTTPVPSVTPTSSRRLLQESSAENKRPTTRKLKSGDDGTHRPTISSAPTLTWVPYTNVNWEWLQMTSGNSKAWCNGKKDMTRGTLYYIYDKTGTHLLQSGTMCSDLASLKCWMVLPPNGDYILRIGGALDSNRANVGADFCGHTRKFLTFRLSLSVVTSQSHFEFSITADQQCIPEESHTRTTYCQNELHVQALISGVLLIKDLYLTEGLSPVDDLLIGKAFDSLFSDAGVSVTIRYESSSDGALLSFTLGIPVTYYGYTNTLYNAPHLTYLRAHDDIISFFRTDLFASMLDTQIHSYLNQDQKTVTAAGQCHLKTHGAISLLSIDEKGWENVVPHSDIIYPITFYPEKDDQLSNARISSFQTGIPTFLIVILVGGTLLYLLYSKKRVVSSPTIESPTSKTESSPSYFKKHFKYIYDFTHVRSPPKKHIDVEENNYQVLRNPSDDVEAHHARKQIKTKVSIILFSFS